MGSSQVQAEFRNGWEYKSREMDLGLDHRWIHWRLCLEGLVEWRRLRSKRIGHSKIKVNLAQLSRAEQGTNAEISKPDPLHLSCRLLLFEWTGHAKRSLAVCKMYPTPGAVAEKGEKKGSF